MAKLALIGCVQAMYQALFIWVVIGALEMALPKRGRITAAARLKGFSLSTISWLSTGATSAFIAAALGLANVRPLLAFPPQPTSALGIGLWALGGGLLGVLSFDFFYYWFHRAQHALPVLWRFHAVHHAIEDVSLANGYAHWSDELLRLPFIALPVALLVPANMPALPFAGLIMSLQANYVHSQTRLHLGPFWRLIYDNRFHRIHHSIEERHFDKNFGVFTPLWDWMFGTLYVPATDEWPATGLVETPEVAGVLDYLFRPFRRNTPARPPAMAGAE